MMNTSARIRSIRLLTLVLTFLVVLVAMALPGWAGMAKTRRVSVSSGVEGNGASYEPSISADGRFLAFSSDATNLVGGDVNGVSDVFMRDRKTGATKGVTVIATGVEGDRASYTPSISADGRFVAFFSNASNLVDGDTNDETDVFVWDRKAGTTKRVSVNFAGVEGNAGSLGPSISADGRFVAYSLNASNLVGGDANGGRDVFVRDRKNHTTKRMSVSSAGVEGNGASYTPSISADGRFVAYSSNASNLVGGDANGGRDVFVRDRKNHTTRRVSVSSAGTEANGNSFGRPSISAAGRFVAFDSGASNLVGGDTNGVRDAFVRGPLR
jgi:Tol biopolymer transport system component